MPHRKRRDAQQAEIIGVLRKCGYSAFELSQVGAGCPDWLVSKAGKTYLVEIKSAKGKLRPSQIAFARSWQGRIYILHSVEDAITMVEQEKAAWMPDVKTLLDAIAELESAAEDCGYYCEPPDDADNPPLRDARHRRHKASQRIEDWMMKSQHPSSPSPVSGKEQ